MTTGGMIVASGVTANSAKFNTKMWSESHTGQAHDHRDSVVISGGLRVLNTGLTIAKSDHVDIRSRYGLRLSADGEKLHWPEH